MRAEATLPASARADAPPADERPVFAAADGRRARRLRVAALLAAALVGLWVAALAAGMLGFGRLPGVPDLTSRPPDAHRATAPGWTRTPPGGGGGSLFAAPAGRAATLGRLRAPTTSPGARSTRPASGAHRSLPAGSRGAGGARPTPARAPARANAGVPSTGAATARPGHRVGQSTTAPTTSARPSTPPGQQRRAAPTTGSGTLATPGHGQGATRTTATTG